MKRPTPPRPPPHQMPSEETILELADYMRQFVVPIMYCDPEYNDTPKNFGSGFIVRKLNKHFLVTAAHVLHRLKLKSIDPFISVKPGLEGIYGLTASYWSTCEAKDVENDPYDVAVTYLNDVCLPSKIGEVTINSLPITQFALKRARTNLCVFPTGFPISKSSLNKYKRLYESAFFVGVAWAKPLEQYTQYDRDPDQHIICGFDQTFSFNEKWKRDDPLIPTGISGGPMWVVDKDEITEEFTPRVIGVLVEQPDKVMIATDVACALQGIEDLYQRIP
jgi:hypothetical protein